MIKLISTEQFQINENFVLDILTNALCNSYSTGNSDYWIGDIIYDKDLYALSKHNIIKNDETIPSFEDILVQMLKDNYELQVVDSEIEDDVRVINIDKIYENAKNLPKEIIISYLHEQDDADTGDVALQILFLGEIIYG